MAACLRVCTSCTERKSAAQRFVPSRAYGASTIEALINKRPRRSEAFPGQRQKCPGYSAPLSVIDSPYRDKEVVSYSPPPPRSRSRDILCVYLPEFVVEKECLLHRCCPQALA